MSSLLIFVIVIALCFDFINGFHDAANSIATVVSTKVLSPAAAVIWAAAFNFLAYWIFPLKVADTVAKTVKMQPNMGNIGLVVVCSGVIAAIIWNLFTWWRGIPSSSSHTLIGGFAGAGIAHYGSFSAVNMQAIAPALYFIVLAPVIGMIVSYFISILTLWICRNTAPSRVDKVFRRLQLVSSAAYSLGHGGNDAQKVMGIIAAAMVAQGMIGDIHSLPWWVPVACYTSISLGTMIGGWKIVKTMGQKVTKLTPFEGFSAETGGALTLFGAQYFKIPVSTTHTITGSIIGTGLTKRISAVRWGVTLELVWAWVLTIPVSALMGAAIYEILSRVI